jgi:threonine dehydrogenase-like Zn-dependent dehydrogenase
MKALTWHGMSDIRCENVPDSSIVDPTDAIVRITSTAICGSDLHLYDGFNPFMEKGDILGHEPMGIVEEVGSEVRRIKRGDRVVIPFTISCGACFFCQRTEYSLCDTSNRNAEVAQKLMGQAPAGLFGYSHLTGGFAGGQAQYLRVPFADVGPLRIDSDLSDEQCSSFPTSSPRATWPRSTPRSSRATR